MKTNLDRLHKVALEKLQGRGIGKTLLKCHEVCGIIEVNNNPLIIGKVKYSKDFYFILKTLKETLDEHEIKIDRITYNSIIGSNFTIILLPQADFDRKVLGYSGYFLVDFIDY